jgi:hypothetical protein
MENLTNNKFLKTIIDNNDLSEETNMPKMQHIIALYVTQLFNNLFPSDSGILQKFGMLLMFLIHIIATAFLMLGWLLPSKILIFHVVFCVLTLISIKLGNGTSCVSNIMKNMFNIQDYDEVVSLDVNICKTAIIISMILSIQGIVFKRYSYYSLVLGLLNDIEFLH